MNQEKSIKVSIITPSYNQGKYLEQTIQSVLDQTYKNIEYMVIDGGSTDNTVDIIKKYEKRIAYWISEPDRGQADAINKGFKLANGELVCWLNSDDIIYPDFVEKRVKQFAENPDTDMIYGDIDHGADTSTKRVKRGKQTNITNMLKFAECPIPQQGAIWKKSTIEKIGSLNPKWHVVLDREYFTRIAAKGKIKYIPGAVAFFRNHEDSKSIAGKLQWTQELPEYYEALFDDNIYDLSDELLSYKNKCLSEIYLKCARICERADKNNEAQDFYNKAKSLRFFNYIYQRYIKR